VSIEPVIISRSQHPISRTWISPNALRVLYRLKESGRKAYLVGGGVRDLLLGREPKDFDIATDATPNEVKKIFRNCRLIGRRFRLAHIHFHDEIIEVATFRALASEIEGEQLPVEPPPAPATAPEQDQGAAGAPAGEQPPPQAAPKPRPPRMLKTEDGMILRDNVWGTAEEDALRRDFTVNALIYNIADYSVIDYVGGMEDIRKGLIRIIGDPVVRFTEDPVRMVRAVRFASLLGFEIEEKTYQAMLELKDRVALANPSRMYEEMQKLFLSGEGEKTFQLLRKTGMFAILFPSLNEWLDTEAGGFPHTWVGKALEWVDTCVQSGRKVEPHTLFALMFGQYLEEKAAGFRAAGVHPLPALEQAVAELMAEQVKRIQVPRKVGLIVRDILWSQHRFEKREGKKPLYFLRRVEFPDAFEYFRFSSETTGVDLELRAWWKEFIKAHPPAAGERQDKKTHGRKPAGKHDRPKRRRRRRGPRKPEGQKPKA
jgi:poly(A) polymerase